MKNQKAVLRREVALLAGMLVAGNCEPSRALNVWSGASGSLDWSNAGNWLAGVPITGDDLFFGEDNVETSNSFDIPSLSIHSMTFIAGAAAFTTFIQSGNALTLNAGGAFNQSSNTQTFQINANLNNPGDTPSTMSFTNGATAENLQLVTQGAYIQTQPVTVDFFQAGLLQFSNASTAASAVIINDGAGFAGGLNMFVPGGITDFMDASTAASATIFNVGGTSHDAAGGTLAFSGTAMAANATIDDQGGGASSTTGGMTSFTTSSSAGSAHITNDAGVAGAPGGILFLNGSAAAGSATILNRGPVASGGGVNAGETQFIGAASAGNSSITNGGSGLTAEPGALTSFAASATAGSAAITNQGGGASGAAGGSTTFAGTSTANTATINNSASTVVGALGGTTQFSGSATAGNAGITNNGSVTDGDLGGSTSFGGSANGGTATIVNKGGAAVLAGAGATSFSATATAQSASITNFAGAANGGDGGSTNFAVQSTAGSSTIVNNAAVIAGAESAITTFHDLSSAGSATITNGGPAFTSCASGETKFYDSSVAGTAQITNAGDSASGADTAVTDFLDTSSADHASIINSPGTTSGASGGATEFINNSTLGNATITNSGALAAGNNGGTTIFGDSASAGDGTIINNDGATGGRTFFVTDSDGGTARAITNGAGQFDISGLSDAGMGIGSIEGSGNYSLGGKNLSVGGNGMNTTVSGVIQDGGIFGGAGGSLTKTGTGQLVLGNVNTYTGGTTVNSGALVVGVNGALPDGNVSITGGALQLAASTGLAQMTSLSIAGNGTLDIGNNHIIINYGGGADPVSTIRGYLTAGFAGGKWTGDGIDSSTAALPANNGHYGVGYADGANGIVSGLTSGQIEIMYTFYGDANLDGVVNGDDFTILAGNIGKPVAAWDRGDFNYDGAVNGDDFTALVGNLGKKANGTAVALPASDYAAIDAFAAANGLTADVPEPTSFGLPGLAAVGLFARRRHMACRKSSAN